MLLSCCFIVSFICALLISDFAYLLSARFIRVLFVSLFFCVLLLSLVLLTVLIWPYGYDASINLLTKPHTRHE